MACSICYEEIDETRKLHCGHVFCASCISTWKSKNASCPNCRQPISRKYFREKSKCKSNHIQSVNHLYQIISKIEIDGSKLFEDDEKLQWTLYELYERLDHMEQRLNTMM